MTLNIINAWYVRADFARPSILDVATIEASVYELTQDSALESLPA